MSEALPQTPDEPRSNAQADLGGGMYTYYREGGFPGLDRQPNARASRLARKGFAPTGPIRGESEADTGPADYHVLTLQDHDLDETTRTMGYQGVDEARAVLDQIRKKQ